MHEDVSQEFSQARKRRMEHPDSGDKEDRMPVLSHLPQKGRIGTTGPLQKRSLHVKCDPFYGETAAGDFAYLAFRVPGQPQVELELIGNAIRVDRDELRCQTPYGLAKFREKISSHDNTSRETPRQGGASRQGNAILLRPSTPLANRSLQNKHPVTERSVMHSCSHYRRVAILL
jgi:hypothetical protein